MSLTKQEMWDATTDRYLYINKLYKDPDVSAESMFEELCCSIYGGDEWNEAEAEAEAEAGPSKPVKISENEFKYRDTVFRVTHDETDDKSYIWCSKFKESDELVDWTWGCVFAGDTWLIGTDVLDKFIDSHEEKQNG